MRNLARNAERSRGSWRSLCKGSSGGSGRGGGGGARSERNSLGQETAYGGEERNVGNSRLFGVNEEVQNISNYRSYDATTQAGVIESTLTQLRNRNDDGALTQRASRDIETLYNNTSSEARDILASQGIGDLRATNPASQRIIRDVADRQQRAEEARQAARQRNRNSSNSPRPSFDDDDDDFGGLFG